MKAHKQAEDTRLALLEQSIGHINQALQRIENRFNKIDNSLDSIEINMKQGFKDINNRIWTNFLWLIGTYIAGFTGMCKVVDYMINH